MTDRGQIYLVYGSHGEYSDYRQWNVAAFTKEDRANVFRDLVQEKYNAAHARYKEDNERWYEQPDESIPFPDPTLYSIKEDKHAPVDSGYEATYAVTPVPFNVKL